MNLNKCYIKRQSNVYIDIFVSFDLCYLLVFNWKCICMYVLIFGIFLCKNNIINKLFVCKNIKFIYVLYIFFLNYKFLFVKK